jgi:hypothetical protein
MYPLVEWKYQGIIERIQRLNSSDLFYESVIASAQVYEQVLKRILRNQLAPQGLMIAKEKQDNGQFRLILKPADSLGRIDEAIRHNLNSTSTIHKKAWNLAMNAPARMPTASGLMISITSQNEWHCLIDEEKIERSRWPESIRQGAEDLAIDSIRCGLIPMRHKIVHGPNSPDPRTIKPLAFFGESFLAKVLCPSTGIASQGIRDPLKKCSRFRKQV